MKRKFRNDDESQSSSLSSNKAIQESREPCEICGSVGIEGLIMTCFKCRDTREHTYCARISLPSVPPIWLCEMCRFSSRVLLIPAAAEDLTDIETGVADCSLDPKNSNNSREEDHETARLRTNDMEEVAEAGISLPVSKSNSSHEIAANVSSVIHAPSEPHTSSGAKEGKELHQLLEAFPKKPRNIRWMSRHISQSHQSLTEMLHQSVNRRRFS
ncbi:unnamed protein product [Arabis nemorensis]|uniref:Zinc finger PHD-type domain-containing protein n=1 Tax=Arabis nemorensis TaxID=586526 RepID=A0A565CUY6_9BRAS|nr:unnamed protein product [Arabis nemorensis]